MPSPTRAQTSFNRIYRKRGGFSTASFEEILGGATFLVARDAVNGGGSPVSGVLIGIKAASYSAFVSDNVPIPARGINTRSGMVGCNRPVWAHGY
jgi:hypothetical protein